MPLGEAEIFFAHLDQARSQQLFGDNNFVFSGELKYMLGLAKVMAERTDEAKVNAPLPTGEGGCSLFLPTDERCDKWSGEGQGEGPGPAQPSPTTRSPRWA